MPLIDDTVGAFIEVFQSPLMGAAGPLSGLTFAAKDNLDVAGKVTGNGNPAWRAAQPAAGAHASAVERVLSAGASLVGKTHMDEFAYSLMGTNAHYGTPLNSAAPERVPGGSSSGSAAAVAAGLVDFALGTDTGGSVRLPASFCGIFGIRSSHGAVDMSGVVPMAPGFDALGWFARDAAMLARVGGVFGLSGVADYSTPWLPADIWDALDPRVAHALRPYAEAAADRIGRVVRDPLAIVGAAERAEAFRLWQGRDVWRAIGIWVEANNAKLGPDIAARFAAAKAVDAATFEKADATRKEIAAAMEEALDKGVVLILPTAPGPAPRKNSTQEAFDRFRKEAIGLLSIAAHARLPQISMPAATVDGAPVGLSLVGARGSDAKLLALAEALKGIQD